MRISTGYGSRPTSGGFETFSWYFMRISAIGLFFLAIIHLFINHVTTDVACTSYQLIAARYANPYWRDHSFHPPVLAHFHCINRLRAGGDDFIKTRTSGSLSENLLGVLLVLLFLCGGGSH